MGSIWKIRNRMIGGKKASHEATAIVDPKNGKLGVSKNNIKSVALDYCQATLNNNVPNEENSEEIVSKKVEVQNKMLEENGTIVMNRETFNLVISTF